MKNKILLVVSLLLVLIYFMSFPNQETSFNNEEKTSEIEIKIKDNNGNITNMSLEDYVVGVVSAEMPASFSLEALKAQAIAARTYAMYKKQTAKENYDLVTNVSNQGYINTEEMKTKWGNDYEKYYNKVKEAVTSTKNLVIKSNNVIICAYYFAMSNGYTEDSQTVFGEKLEYISPIESDWDKNLNNYEKTISLSKSQFCVSLNLTCNQININQINRNNTNHVIDITINNTLFSGTNFRKLLNLRSTDFDLEITNDNINITTRGYGHDVGMSQYGANEMAKLGYSYQEIINYYYKNIEITLI